LSTTFTINSPFIEKEKIKIKKQKNTISLLDSKQNVVLIEQCIYPTMLSLLPNLNLLSNLLFLKKKKEFQQTSIQQFKHIIEISFISITIV